MIRKGFFHKICRWGTYCIIAGMVLYGALAGIIVWNGLADDVFAADVAVVLGNTVGPDGQPSPRLAARLDRALELYRQGMCARIIVSGGFGAEGFDEAVAMRRYLVERGVSEDVVIVDSHGLTTRATARFVADYLKTHDLSSVLAVSQYFHTPRTRLALQQTGIEKVGHASARYVEWRDIYSILREVPATAAYWLAGKLS